MTSIKTYRERLRGLEGGTVPVSFVREALDAAEEEIRASRRELTIRQARLRSGRGEEWIRRRLPRWKSEGLARKVGSLWLISEAAVPEREASGAVVDLATEDPEAVAERLFRRSA